ncbi:MAG: flippase-like domain-containing protein [Planctomycetaceae bacterium]|nr:flippase-like domain-containing protein [Planctomycetaceae bacterium]
MSHEPETHTQPVRKQWYRTKAFNLSLGLGVTVGCLWWAYLVIADGRPAATVFREIGSAFAQANYWTLPPIWLLLFVFYWIKAWRWRMLLAPQGDFRTSTLFPPVMIGFAFNNVLPAHLGEFVRVFVFSRQQRQPFSPVLISVILERVLDIIAILGLLMLGLLFVPDLQQNEQIRGWMFVGAGFVSVALLGAAAYLIWTKPFVSVFEWFLQWIPFLPASLKEKLSEMLEQGASGLSSLKSGRLLAGLLFTSLLQWMINGVIISLALWSFGFHFSIWVSCIVIGVTAFGVTIPSSPGYFGVIQTCFLLVLQFFTDDKDGVFAASIYYHMAQWIPVTAIGLAYFVRTRLHVSDIEDAREEMSHEVEETATKVATNV